MSRFRKFIASAITAVGVLGAALLTSDADWRVALATFVTSLAGAGVVLLVPNESA